MAVVEIVSPGNKDRLEHVEELAGKIDGFLGSGVHVLLIDLVPPGAHDPRGVDAVVREFYSGADRVEKSSPCPPPCAVTYCAAPTVSAYFRPLTIGGELPEAPLFIHPQRYINAPLDDSYLAAYRGVPQFVKKILDHSG